MHQLLTISLLLAFPLLLPAQSNLINNGAIIKVGAGVDVKVAQGNIRNDNSGTIDNQGAIYLNGNFNQVNGATYTGGATSWLYFEGDTVNLTSDAPLNIARLRVDNGNRLVLGNHINVSTNVDLTNNGNIELGNFNLVLTSAATINNYDASNYIVTNGTGFLQQEVGASAVIFPIGNNLFNPATLSNSGTVDNFQARVVDYARNDYPSGLTESEGMVGKAWFIEEGTVGGSDISMTLQWETSDELPDFDRSSSGISHWTGTAWDRSPAWTGATNIAATTWTQTRTGITSFSPFTVEDVQLDLPIELLSFGATRLNTGQVQLDWVTASELNNQGFETERMLANETEFQQIHFVEGQGNTTNSTDYQLLDENIYEGMSYYRLKQIDFDGSESYSNILAVAGLQSNNIFGGTVFPNPVKNVLNVRFSELPAGIKSAEFSIIDIHGKPLQSFRANIQAYRLTELESVEDLAPGFYILSVQLDNGEEHLARFVKK